MRAEGLEPPSSFEHWHLKPACLPISSRPPASILVAHARCRGHPMDRIESNICSFRLRIGPMHSRDEFLAVKRLVSIGHADHKIVRLTGIPRRTISGWRRGESRGCDRDECSGGLTPRHDFSKLDSKAYAYLLGLYLGDGCISAGRRGVWCLRVTLDAAYPGIIHECAVALEAIFPAKTARRGRRRDSATERKGSYVRRAPRYAFSNKSEDIKRLFCESCDVLGVRWTRPSDRQIAIYRKESVARLDEFVGPKR